MSIINPKIINLMTYYLSLLSKHRSALMGFAMLWVMSFHFMQPDLPLLKNFLSIGYGGVDIFLFLSGFGLYFSMSKPNLSLSDYYRSRICRVIPEFWLFLFFTFILSNSFDLKSFGILLCKMSTLGYWFHAPFSLWYISCIIVFYALFPFYYRFFKKWGLKVPIIIIVVGLSMIALYGIVMVYIFDNVNVGKLLILSISRIPIFVIGSVFGYIVKEKKSLIYKPVSPVLFICFITFIMFGFVIMLMCFMKFYREYCWTCSLYFLPFIVITPVLCIVMSVLFDKIPCQIVNGFSWIGALSLELYIVHEYIYTGMFSILGGRYPGYLIFILALLLIFISAIMLQWINSNLLQKLFEKRQ